MAVQFLGLLAVSGFFSKIFVYVFDVLVMKYGRKLAFTILTLTAILAMFAVFWSLINGLLITLKYDLGAQYLDLLPIFLPANTDNIIAAALAIRTGAAIIVFNARFVKLFSQF